MVRAGPQHPARDLAPGVLAELSGAGVLPESVISRARVLSVQRLLCREGQTCSQRSFPGDLSSSCLHPTLRGGTLIVSATSAHK